MGVRAKTPEGFGRLHVITDPTGPHPVIEVVEAALAAGAPVIQVRQKSGTDRDRLAAVEAVLGRCRATGATCLVDDRVDLALAAGADGVHLGADDLPVTVARRVLGPEATIGATTRDPDDARAAEADGADYLGVGPTHPTDTKHVGHPPLGEDGVAEVARSVGIPVVAIAGVDVASARRLRALGVTGVAVIGAVSRAEDPQAACTALLEAVERVEPAEAGA
jgi:thiamine-phosphate pyrophosphorylase